MDIVVANLSSNINEYDLRYLFEEYGKVDTVKVIMDRTTGRSRGVAFVKMQNDDDGHRAINALNDSVLGDRNIVVKKEDHNGRRGGSHRGGYNRD